MAQPLTFIALPLGGPLLLTIAAGACALAAIFLSWRLVTGGQELGIVLLIAYTVTLLEWSVRPQVFSLLLTVVAIRLVLFGRYRSCRCCWCCGPTCMPLCARHRDRLGAAPRRHCVRSRAGPPRMPVALLSLAAPAMTPLGVHFWPWLLDTVARVARAWPAGVPVGVHAGSHRRRVLAARRRAVVGIVRKRTVLAASDRQTRQLVIAAVILAPAALTSLENIPFFALVAIPAIAPIPDRERGASTAGEPDGVGLMGAAALVAIVMISIKWTDGGRYLGGGRFRLRR